MIYQCKDCCKNFGCVLVHVHQVSVVQGEGREKKKRKEGRKGGEAMACAADKMRRDERGDLLGFYCLVLCISVSLSRPRERVFIVRCQSQAVLTSMLRHGQR